MARKNLNDVQPIELVVEHDKPMASSLQVAKHFGKAHDNVLRDIRNLLRNLPEDWHSRNFEDTNISKNLSHAMRQDPVYLLTRDGFTMLAMGFTGKKAVEWKIKYIEAFNHMEKTLWNRRIHAGAPIYSIPPREDDAIRRERQVKILRALAAQWANLDAIRLETAETSLCLHLDIPNLESISSAHGQQALSFLLRALHRPRKTGKMATQEQADSIHYIVEGCRQFRASRDGDVYAYLRKAYDLTPSDFENLTEHSANKLISALSCLFFQLFGRSEFMALAASGEQGQCGAV